MYKKIIVFFLALITTSLLPARTKFPYEPYHDLDFDASMGINLSPFLYKKIKQWWGPHLFTAFEDLYDKNKLSKRVYAKNNRIPKRIHQIWLGGKLPQRYLAYQKSWQEKHPTWEYKLWTDKDIKKLKLYNQDLFDNAKDYREKADILRYELLYRFGGIYADVDFECLKPFDIFNYAYDFYACLEPIIPWYYILEAKKYPALRVCIGLMASRAEHPTLKHCIDTMAQDCSQYTITIQKTGPDHFTRSCMATLPELKKASVILPATFFVPVTGTHVLLQGKKQQEKHIQPESFATTHWFS